MKPPTFLTGKAPHGLLWAAVDPNVRHLESKVADRRFGAYLAPFQCEVKARLALLDAGALSESIQPETGRRGKRG